MLDNLAEEYFGDVCMECSMAKLLQDSLALDYTLTLDCAHRSLLLKAKDSDPLRTIAVKFHYFQERMDILRNASSQHPVQHNNKQIFIYPDHMVTITKRWAGSKRTAMQLP